MAEAKTVSLNIGERLGALKIFDSFKGGLATLRILLEDVKQFPITDEEWKEANLTKTPQPDGSETWKWNETAVTKDITLQPESVEYLKSAIKAKSDSGEITLQDIPLSTLEQKLNA